MIHLEEWSTRPLPLHTRKSLLCYAVCFADPLRWVSHRNERGEQLLEEACAKGWEGLIAKRADALYHHARSRTWLKFECVAQQELVISGFTDPEGGRDRFGALLVGYHDDEGRRYAGKVGTGYDQQALEQLGELLEQRERDDKEAEEVVRETPDACAGPD